MTSSSGFFPTFNSRNPLCRLLVWSLVLVVIVTRSEGWCLFFACRRKQAVVMQQCAGGEELKLGS